MGEAFVMFNTVVLSVRCQVRLVVGHTLFELVPIGPTVLDGVVLQHIEAFHVCMIGVLRKAMESFTSILLGKFFYKE